MALFRSISRRPQGAGAGGFLLHTTHDAARRWPAETNCTGLPVAHFPLRRMSFCRKFRYKAIRPCAEVNFF